MSRRTLALLGTAVTTVGGVILTYVVPTALALDVRFVIVASYAVGLLAGLSIALRTTSPTSRRKALSDMIPMPTSGSSAPVQAVIAGQGYLSTKTHGRDDLSVVFTYRAAQPYSVLVDIAAEDPHSVEASDSVIWEVSRETLHDAVLLGTPSGVGDFSAVALSARRMRLRIMGADAWGRDTGYHYDMILSRTKLQSFLLRTMAVVPVGQESEHLDMDRQLERLLAS